jgi:hypothetical protein
VRSTAFTSLDKKIEELIKPDIDDEAGYIEIKPDDSDDGPSVEQKNNYSFLDGFIKTEAEACAQQDLLFVKNELDSREIQYLNNLIIIQKNKMSIADQKAKITWSDYLKIGPDSIVINVDPKAELAKKVNIQSAKGTEYLTEYLESQIKKYDGKTLEQFPEEIQKRFKHIALENYHTLIEDKCKGFGHVLKTPEVEAKLNVLWGIKTELSKRLEKLETEITELEKKETKSPSKTAVASSGALAGMGQSLLNMLGLRKSVPYEILSTEENPLKKKKKSR